MQVCWHKFARYFDVEIREIPLERGRLGMTPEEALKRVRREHDRRDADLRRDLHLPLRAGRRGGRRRWIDWRATSSLDIPIHVDAASGGFIAPFIEPELEWDFRIPRV